MASFQNPDGSYANESAGAPVTTANPASAATVAMANTDSALYITNSTTLAALTIKLKSAPRNGEKVELAFESAVTALTVQDYKGGAITGAPTAGAANAAVVMRYVNNTVGWVHWK